MNSTPPTHFEQTSQPVTPVQEQIISVLQEMLSCADASSSVPAKRKRGRPATLQMNHLWLALFVTVLQSSQGFRDVFRALTLEPLGTFSRLSITYEAVRSRLLKLGTDALEHLYYHIQEALAQRERPISRSALPLAAFAPEIVALDETTLDKVKRLTEDLQDKEANDPRRFAGKLAGLFDIRRQQWRCLQLRTDIFSGCNIGILMLLDNLPRGSLILADLGYFGFPWFDYLTNAGYWYISRLREKVTYEIKHIHYQDKENGVLDAIVWLGAGASGANHAAFAVRLIQFTVRGKAHQYITNVLDYEQLSILEIAQLYARRWDIELTFKLLKRNLGLHLWWAARQELIEIQLWVSLILAQVLFALRFDIAEQAEADLLDVSLDILIKTMKKLKDSSTPLLQRIVQYGREWGVIRPNRRKLIIVPAIRPDCYQKKPENMVLQRKAKYEGRNSHPRKRRFVPLTQDRFILPCP